jgi:hypothetical protein
VKRRISLATLGLSLFLLGCSSVAMNDESEAAASAAPSTLVSTAPSDEPVAAPSGKPTGLVLSDTLREYCPENWVEGLLVADVEVKNGLSGHVQLAPTAIEVGPADAVAWPAGVDPQKWVLIRWPMDYSGLRMADGEVAVLDEAGHLVATTGRKYRLTGDWAVYGSISGNPLPNGGFDGFNACRGREFVIPQ